MRLWMDVMRDLEHVMDDHERLFDAWAAGGVDGLVIGPLEFNAAKLLPGVHYVPGATPPTPTFDPDPQVYRSFDVPVPDAPTEALPERRKLLMRTLSAAKDRGWSVYIFQAGAGAALPPPPAGAQGAAQRGNAITDEGIQRAMAARMVDALNHYPMVDGAIMDGPEWGYEIAPHHYNHRSDFFNDLPESLAPACDRLGYDYAQLVSAKDSLYARLHNLQDNPPPSETATPDTATPDMWGPAALHAGFQRLHPDPNLTAWLQFRLDTLTGFFAGIRERVDAHTNRPVKLGVGPRSAGFAPLCGYDMPRLGQILDVLLPKHYFFQRGFDGMLGTILRYVETLVDWNPGLSDAAALDVVATLFGLRLPGVTRREDLESTLDRPEFYTTIVAQETRRALAAVDDPQRIVPWVDAGRAPHDGDPMPAGQLRALMQAAGDAGLQRILYHHHGNLTPGEWAVMSELCGTPWRPLESAYAPPDQLVL
ncbi:MAG: hypothetical protein WDZ49_00485 [Litorilinea sp.]